MYITLDELRSSLRIPDGDDDAALELALEAASALIDQHCGRTFGRSASATAKRFAPDDATVLRVNDIATTSGLVVRSDTNLDGTFETVWDPSWFQTEPLNAADDGLPVTTIRTLGTPYLFPRSSLGRATVEVTATWGWPEVPAPVKMACQLQAARLFKRADAPFGIAGTPDVGQMRILSRLDPDVQVLLAQFRDPRRSRPGSLRIV